MFIMLVLLCAAMVPTAHFTWQTEDTDDGCDRYSDAPCPQACDSVLRYYGKPPNTNSIVFQNLCVSVFLLCYGYLIRLAKMSPYLSSKSQLLIGIVKKSATAHHARWIPHALGTPWQMFKTMILQPLWIAFLHCVVIQVDLFTSMFAEVCEAISATKMDGANSA